MSGIDEVTPKVAVEGGEEAAGVFTKIGSAAQQGFEQAASAAAAAESRLRQIEATAQRAGVSIEEMAARVKRASEDLRDPLGGGAPPAPPPKPPTDSGGGGDNDGGKKAADDAAKAADEAKKHFHELGIIGAEAFAKILEAAANGNFTGVLASMFGKTAAAIYEVVHAATEFVESQASMVETLNNLAQATGMTLGQIEGLKDAFASVGISTSGFERAIGRLAMTIGNEWSSIQQTVRTASDEQTGSLLHVREAALNLEKAYNSLSEAFTHSAQTSAKDALNLESTANSYTKAAQEYSMASSHLAQTAAHDSLAVESAALNLRKAGEELADFALKSQQNSVSLEGASVSLESAQMNLRKARGETVSKDEEKQLRIRQAEVAVEEAGLRIIEARNKKLREDEELEERKLKKAKAEQEARDAAQKKSENATKAGLEMAEKELAVRKAAQEASDAQTRAIEDQVKATQRLKEAHLAVEKARLAEREAAEKAHQGDLKDIPAIAKEIDQVVGGYKKWADVMNHAEISAQNLTKAVILAASGGSGQPPKAMEVFKEMASMFKNMGTDADSMNKKLEIVQHTMGAGFRSGQASAAQLLAILNRGPEALEKFMQEAEKFEHVKIGGFDLHKTEEALTKFNSAFSSMNATIDQVKNRFAAIMAEPLGEFFDKVRESIQKDDGALRQLADTLANGLRSGIEFLKNDVGPVFSRLGSMVGDVVKTIGTIANAFHSTEGAVFRMEQVIKVSLGVIKLAIDGWRMSLAGVLIAIGAVGAAWDWATTKGKSWNDSLKDSKVYQAGKEMAKSASDDLMKDAAQVFKDAAATEKDAASKSGAAAEKGHEAASATGAAAEKTGSAADKGHAAADALGKSGDGLITAGKELTGSATSLNQAANALSQAASRVTAPTGKAASGGHIRGPGGPTDDTAGVFALSDGEFVVRSAAVSHYGPQLFHALNDMAVGGFAGGGQVGESGGGSSSSAASKIDTATDDLKKTIHAFADMVNDVAKAFDQSIKDITEVAINAIKSAAATVAAKVSASAVSAVDKASSAAAAKPDAQADGTPWGMATGGHIRGPGGPTDDHAGLFALSNGEFVVRSAAVSHYGPQLFEALNDMSVGGFASGGRVGGGFPMFPTQAQFDKMWEPVLNKLGKVTNAMEENARAMYQRETGKKAPADWQVGTGIDGQANIGPAPKFGIRSTYDPEDRYYQAKKQEREEGAKETARRNSKDDGGEEYSKWFKGELEKRGIGNDQQTKPQTQKAIPVEVTEFKGATQPFMPNLEKAISEAIKASTLGQFNKDGRETGAETMIRRAKEADPEKFAPRPKEEEKPKAEQQQKAETASEPKTPQTMGEFLKDVLKVAISPEMFEKGADLKATPSGSGAIDKLASGIEKFTETIKMPGDAYAGKYNVPNQTPGKLTEEDVFRKDQAKEQEQRDANKMSSWGTGAAGLGVLEGKIAHLIPDLVPGIFDKLSKEPGSNAGKDSAGKTADASPLKDAAKAQTDAAAKTDGAMTAIGKAMGSLEDHAGKSGDHQEKSEQAAEKTDTAAGKTDTAATGLQAAAEQLQAAAGDIGSAAQQGPTGMATGGHIRGPGGPTEDKAGLFALSNNEYVMRSAAVDHYGPQLFDALNSLSVGGFATGGIVGAVRAPRSMLEPTGPHSTLNLTIDGNHFNGLRAPEAVASKLKSYAVARQASAAQQMPSWYQ